MRATSRRLVVALALGALVLAGCGGGASDAGPSDPSYAASDRPTTDRPTSAAPSAPAKPVRRDRLLPPLAHVRSDRPDLYADGCQVAPESDEPTGCAYGASAQDATATIAVIGDSKSAQWSTALQRLAETRGWRVLIYTKSGCAAVAVPMSMDGEEYASCTRFDRTVSAELVANPVDLLLTSNTSDTALVTDLAPGQDAREASLDAFVAGEKKAWTTWIEAGNRVAVISDIPRPTRSGSIFDVPRCVEKHRDYLERCSFDRAAGEALSGRTGQVRGVEEMGAVDVSPALLGEDVPGATDAPLAWVDPLGILCPQGTCPPADGRILIYREGSHLTDTYVASLTDRIGAVMTALGLP
ncbi:SGNH hydrolase domain-containing protein [Nocardioides plantarum]|uniref:SGNH hydrolase domain-containing protein n=1 Tax=Nocardioides plantarum TaxID=29299 RepID=A0ABV5K961_9ACTN|nr:SGNH hydrolase domain-containing protein [Nocardioides plantarum]